MTLSSADPVSYLDIVQNGVVKHSVRLDDFVNRKGRLPKLHFKQSGWFLVRAVTDLSDTYRLAMTAPYFVEIGYGRRVSKRAAQFFLDWVVSADQADQPDRSSAAQRGHGVSPQGPRFLAEPRLQGQRRLTARRFPSPSGSDHWRDARGEGVSFSRRLAYNGIHVSHG